MKRNILFAAAFAVILSMTGCSKPAVPVGVLLDQAAGKASEGDWAAAGRLAGEALKQDKQNADALMLKALACSNLDARHEAVEYAIQAARIKPQLFLAQYIQGMLLSKNRKPDLALKALKEARRLRPDDINTLILLAENSMAVRRYQEAAGYFKMLATQDKSYRSSPYLWNGLGVCYSSRDPKLALRFFQMGARFAPNDPITVLNLAVLHDRYLRLPDNAVSFYERLLQMTDGKAEYDSIRRQAASRLNALKGL